MTKELLVSDASDRDMRVRSKPIKYVVSDEEDFEMKSAKWGSNIGEEEFGVRKNVSTMKQVSKPLAKVTKGMLLYSLCVLL